MARQRGVTTALVAAWFAALLLALGWLSHYKLVMGATATPQESWPAASHLAVRPQVPTLVMFVHPQCPCTRASLAELRGLLPKFKDRVTCDVVFLRPEGVEDSWTHSDTWAAAVSIPGTQTLEDTGGREAALFGATTSGHVVLYAAGGRLLFSGGITPGRGHTGDNPQRDRLVALLESATSSASFSPKAVAAIGAVYGCALQEPVP